MCPGFPHGSVGKESTCPLFIIARTWKQPRCLSADEWIRRLWYIYTMEYYSAIKKNTFEAVLMKWMKLEPIILNEVSQKEKYQYGILHSFPTRRSSDLVAMSFSQVIPPYPSPIESKILFYTSVSLLLSCIQCYRYHLSKFHIYAFSSVQSLSRIRLFASP